MKVAIDGPAGSGKSTVAHALAEREGLTLLDTGAMYRAVTLVAHRQGVSPDDAQGLARIAREIEISFGRDEAGEQTVFVGAEEVTAAIRTAEIDADVSAVSAKPEVREAMVAAQRKLAEGTDVVAEGRDIGTVVFPDAEVKIFLTADAAKRAARRAAQRGLAGAEAEAEIEADLKRRDEADSTRAVAPLVAAPDAFKMDSTEMTVDEEVAAISTLIEAARARAAAIEADTDQPAATAARPKHMAQRPKDEEDEEPKAAAAVEEATQATAETLPAGTEEPQEAAADGGPADARAEQAAASAAEAAREDRGASKADADEEPMSVFGNYDPDTYYDHAIRAFPLQARAVLGAAVVVCAGISKTVWPWSIEHGEAIWDAAGGQVLVMNHVSMLDPVLIVVTDWFHGRRVRPIYKSEFDKHKLVTWFFSRIGAIPVKRDTADVKAVRRAQRALKRGEDVLVFPEGTRIHSEDQEVTIHAGFALMAQLAKAPVLPIAIVGARDGTPGGNGPLRPGRIYLAAGDPITFDQIDVKGRKKQAKEMERRAMEAVYALRDRLRAAHPGKM